MTTTWKQTARDEVVAASSDQDLDEDLLQATLVQYWAKVCRTLYNLVGDWDEAEDLALEVFYRLHKHPPRDTDLIGTWLYRVASNIGLNAIRAQKRRRAYETAAEQLDLQRETPLDPVLESERRQDQVWVRQVLASMRPRNAQLLFLRYYGLSYTELARILSVAPGSVGTLLARAEKEFERRYRRLEGEYASSE
jgi:RNA polymerase sigma-70 factor, ECF subfamily